MKTAFPTVDDGRSWVATVDWPGGGVALIDYQGPSGWKNEPPRALATTWATPGVLRVLVPRADSPGGAGWSTLTDEDEVLRLQVRPDRYVERIVVARLDGVAPDDLTQLIGLVRALRGAVAKHCALPEGFTTSLHLVATKDDDRLTKALRKLLETT